MRKKSIPTIAAIFATTACVSTQDVNHAEQTAALASTTVENAGPVNSAVDANMTRLARYGAILSQGYAGLADRSQTTRDVTSVMIIGIAAEGAMKAVDGASAAALGHHAIAGLTLSETASYLNPATATGGMYLAAKRSLCLSNVAAVAVDEGNDHAAARAQVINGFGQVQLDARASLRGAPPDFESLAKDYAAAVKARQTGPQASRNSRAEGTQAVAEAVKSCLATGQSN